MLLFPCSRQGILVSWQCLIITIIILMTPYDVMVLAQTEIATLDQTFRGHTGDVRSVAWSPDGTRLASGGGTNDSGVLDDDDSVRIWDAETWQELQRLTGHTTGVLSVAWSPDVMRLASGSADDTIRTYRFAVAPTTPAVQMPVPTPSSPTPESSNSAIFVVAIVAVLAVWLLKGLAVGGGCGQNRVRRKPKPSQIVNIHSKDRTQDEVHRGDYYHNDVSC